MSGAFQAGGGYGAGGQRAGVDDAHYHTAAEGVAGAGGVNRLRRGDAGDDGIAVGGEDAGAPRAEGGYQGAGALQQGGFVQAGLFGDERHFVFVGD